MVKLHAPLHSTAARNTLASTLVFARRGSAHTAYPKADPRQPHTPLQTGRRNMFRALASSFADLTPADVDTWQDLAGRQNLTAYNAFMGQNLARWTRFAAPARAWPITEAGTPPAVYQFTATGGVGQVTLNILRSVTNDAWLIFVFRQQTTPLTRAIQNFILTTPWVGTGWLYLVDKPLDPGTYYYRIAMNTTDGVWGYPLPDKERSAVVT
jgi:hypothetical protein